MVLLKNDGGTPLSTKNTVVDRALGDGHDMLAWWGAARTTR